MAREAKRADSFERTYGHAYINPNSLTQSTHGTDRIAVESVPVSKQPVVDLDATTEAFQASRQAVNEGRVQTEDQVKALEQNEVVDRFSMLLEETAADEAAEIRAWLQGNPLRGVRE